MSWTNDVEESIKSAFEQIVGISDWGKSMDLPQSVIDGMVAPYKAQIAQSYREDIPLASILDQADLVRSKDAGKTKATKGAIKQVNSASGEITIQIEGSHKQGFIEGLHPNDKVSVRKVDPDISEASDLQNGLFDG